MTIKLNYGVEFGKCDASDVFEWEVELSPAEESAYCEAKASGIALEKVPILAKLLERESEKIEEQTIEELIDAEDEYAMECQGKTEVDVDEINQLVHSRDPHAIEYFDLGDLDDEELEAWDAAYELDKLPLVEDFIEDFEPTSPFDAGWTLNVWFPEED